MIKTILIKTSGKARTEAFALLTALALLSCGCSAKPAPPVNDTRLLLDTVCTVTLYDPPDMSIISEAMDLCEKYDAMFSISREGSDVWRINHAGGAPVPVDPQTAELIRLGLQYGDYSGGLFDITIGRVSTLWDFSGNPSVPSSSDLAAALATVDYRQVAVTGDIVQLHDPEAWIDLGGIAKGYIADHLAAFLKERGAKGAVIDLGGNIVVIGAKQDGSPWRVGIREPFDESGGIIGALTTTEASVVTSGIYQRQFSQDGVVYFHILDPGTGMPGRTDVVSATVLTDSSAAGDALSTILVLGGSSRAASLLENAPGYIGALLILDDGRLVSLGDADFAPREQ